MSQPARHAVWIILISGLVMFADLGTARLWDRDEPRNSVCAREMMERQDLIVPYFNGELRAHKPVLLYWLMISAYEIFGVNEFSARFWSALLGVGTSLLTYAIGRRMFGARAGLWAATILATALNFGIVARAATPDSLLIFCSTMALAVFVYGAFPKSDRQDDKSDAEPSPPSWFPTMWKTFALMYAWMALAVLAKGPVGVIVPMAVLGLYTLYLTLIQSPANSSVSLSKRQKIARLIRPLAPKKFLVATWKLRPLTALLAVLVIAAPWYVMVGIQTNGAWLEEFFFKHNLSRATSPMENHGGSIVYYPVAMLVGFFPWSIFAIPVAIETIRSLRGDARQRHACLFCLGWIATYLLIFTVAQTKLPSYVIPAYPALALLTGSFLHRWIGRETTIDLVWPRLSFATAALVGLVMLIGLPIAAAYLMPGDEMIGLVGLVPLLGAGVCAFFVQRGRRDRAAVSYAVTAVTLALTVYSFAQPRVDQHQGSQQMVEAIREHGGDAANIAAYKFLEPSVVYYAEKPIPIYYEPSQLVSFFEKSNNGYLITLDSEYKHLRKDLPPDVSIVTRIPRFMKEGELIVLGRPEVYSESTAQSYSAHTAQETKRKNPRR